MDIMLNRVEMYNPNDFDVIVERDLRFDSYVLEWQRPLVPLRQVLKARDFLLLETMYVIFKATNGAPQFDLVQNRGKSIGIGNRLPSRPE